MSEIWVAGAITVVGSVVAGKAAEKKAKQDKKDQKEFTAEEARLNAQATGYERALEDFYGQKERYEKQRGLDQFRHFSTLNDFAPGFDDSGGRVALPTAPDYNTFRPEDVEEAPKEGGGGKDKSLWSKRKDLHKKVIHPFGF